MFIFITETCVQLEQHPLKNNRWTSSFYLCCNEEWWVLGGKIVFRVGVSKNLSL